MDASRLGAPPESLEGNGDSRVNNQGKSDRLWGKVPGCNNDGADPEKLARIRGNCKFKVENDSRKRQLPCTDLTATLSGETGREMQRYRLCSWAQMMIPEQTCLKPAGKDVLLWCWSHFGRCQCSAAGPAVQLAALLQRLHANRSSAQTSHRISQISPFRISQKYVKIR